MKELSEESLENFLEVFSLGNKFQRNSGENQAKIFGKVSRNFVNFKGKS